MHNAYGTICLAFAIALAGCQHNLSTSATSPTVLDTPEALTRQFVDAIGKSELNEAHYLLISRQELESLFSGSGIDDAYAQMATKFNTSLNTLETKMQGAQFVRMNMSYAGEPILIAKGGKLGPFKSTAEFLLLDNVHAILLINGKERDLKLDEMIKVGDSWRLLDAVELN